MSSTFCTDFGSADSNYFAIKVRSRGEVKVATMLRDKGHQVLLPTYEVHLRYSDRIKRRQCALFPGYLFARLEKESLLSLVSTEGVNYIVRNGSSFLPLSDVETQAVIALSQRVNRACEPCLPIAVGERVRITRGVFAGLTGKLDSAQGRDSVVIAIDSLCQAVRLDVERDAISREVEVTT